MRSDLDISHGFWQYVSTFSSLSCGLSMKLIGRIMNSLLRKGRQNDRLKSKLLNINLLNINFLKIFNQIRTVSENDFFKHIRLYRCFNGDSVTVLFHG